jgi:DNA-binding transcriptional ArsR family regulator
MKTAPPILSPLFRSEGQARLLAELLFAGESELSVTDLAKGLDLSYSAVHHEVGRLVDAGLLSERRAGRTRLISLNPESPLTDPVRQLLLVSAGPVPLLRTELADVDGVEAVFLYGSFAARMRGIPGPSPHDIDVMVVGAPEPMQVYAACRRVGELVGRPVNATIMSQDEVKGDSGFLVDVRENPILPVLGELPWR